MRNKKTSGTLDRRTELLKIIARGKDRLEAQCFRTIPGIPSGGMVLLGVTALRVRFIASSEKAQNARRWIGLGRRRAGGGWLSMDDC